MGQIYKENYTLENYPHQVIIMCNMNELMKPNANYADTGLPPHKAVNSADEWPSDKKHIYHNIFRDFSRVKNVVYVGPGNGQL